MANENNIGLEEIHIIKREDDKGFTLKAKAIWNGEPCTIEAPFLKRPNINVSQERNDEYLFGQLKNFSSYAQLDIQAEMRPENNTLYTITVDPDFLIKKQINELEVELEEIKLEANKVSDKIEELKKQIF